MKTLCISLEDSKVSARTDILDWLTTSEINKGINHERYWLINTDVQMQSPDNNYETYLINHLCWLSKLHDYSNIMIIKNVHPQDNTSPNQPES